MSNCPKLILLTIKIPITEDNKDLAFEACVIKLLANTQSITYLSVCTLWNTNTYVTGVAFHAKNLSFLYHYYYSKKGFLK